MTNPILPPTDPKGQPDNVKNWKELDVSTPEGLRALDKIIAARIVGVPVTFIGEGLDIYVYRTELDELDGVPYSWVLHYSDDLNHAIELLDTIKTYHRLEIARLWKGDGYSVKLIVHIEGTNEFDPYVRTFVDSYVSAALGIAMSWLEWHDAQHTAAAAPRAESEVQS